MTTRVVLPNEIWTEIFKYCEADSLAADLPIVCKLFKLLSDVNELWKIKCEQRGIDLALKKPQETYKSLYYFQHLPLFPLFGIKIGKTKESELKAMKNAESNPSRYVTLNKVNFWYNNTDSLFKMMYLVKNIYIIPPDWVKLGIHYEHSWNSLLVYLKEYNHNYQILEAPTEEWFQDRNCFSASVQTIGKCDETYYSVTYQYNYTPGTVDTKGTMYSISVNADSELSTIRTWQTNYENNVFTTMDYEIENEDQVREKLSKELEKNAPQLHRMKIGKVSKPKVIPLVSLNGVTLPNDIWPIIFRHTDDIDLAVNVPRVCKSLHALSSNERMWEEKCLTAGRKNKLDEETWKRYYFLRTLSLFPLFGIVIDQTTEEELTARSDFVKPPHATDRYATINHVNFWFNNSDNVFKMMYIVRGIYPIPKEWLDLGIDFDKSYQEYLEFFKDRIGNYQVIDAPAQKFHSFLQKASFDATVNVCCRHEDKYFTITFAFNYVPGNTRAKNTLYSISLRGAYNTSELRDFKDKYENRVIEHKDPVTDPEESVDNPNYGQDDPPPIDDNDNEVDDELF